MQWLKVRRGNILKNFWILLAVFLFYTSAVSAQHIDTLHNYRIEKIHFVGNKVTKTSIITRELSFKAGDDIAGKDLNKTLEVNKTRIMNTKLFNQVRLEPMEISDSLLHILVEVEERWYLWPSIILRPVDSNLASWWSPDEGRNRDLTRINIGAGLAHDNFRGRGEKLKLSAQFGFSNDYRL